MSKLKSIVKKGKTILKQGLEPYEVGKSNFKHPTPCIEKLAKQRADICKGCEFFKTEPIEEFQVVDSRIPELSKMYCEDCGCISSYKLRQSIEVCERWLPE